MQLLTADFTATNQSAGGGVSCVYAHKGALFFIVFPFPNAKNMEYRSDITIPWEELLGNFSEKKKKARNCQFTKTNFFF